MNLKEKKQQWIAERDAENAKRAANRSQLDFNIEIGLKKLVSDWNGFLGNIAESVAWGYRPIIDVNELVDMAEQIKLLENKFVHKDYEPHWLEDEDEK